MASDPAHKQFVIRRASTPADYVAFRTLTEEYLTFLGENLHFQVSLHQSHVQYCHF